MLEIDGGHEHTCAVSSDYHLYCWGSNGYGVLGIGVDYGQYETPQPVNFIP